MLMMTCNRETVTVPGSSDEGEADTGHSESEDPSSMRVKEERILEDKEERILGVKEESGLDRVRKFLPPKLEVKEERILGVKEEPGLERVREFLPPELELRSGGVWARVPILRSTRFGPFLGKWTVDCPADSQAYWEVSHLMRI